MSRRLLVQFLPDGYAMLMRPNKAETAVHGCHCPGDMAVHMRKVLARPWVGVRVCHLLLLLKPGDKVVLYLVSGKTKSVMAKLL